MKTVSGKRIRDPYQECDLLRSGSTLLDLGLSGNPLGGYIKGRYFYFVGDSSSGKTFYTLTTLAEACLNPEFDDYRLIYDDVEGGALMNIEQFFGMDLAERLEPPAGTKEKPVYSSLVEEFYFHLDDAFNKGQRFIYVLDSQDSLDSLYSRKKFKELKGATRTESKVKGDYGDGKAKFHSTRIRGVNSALRDSGSILIIVNQTRDVIDSIPFGPKSQASGGRALQFYAAAQIWTSVKGKLYKTINKKKRQIGIETKVSIKKNRITGKEWNAVVPIYFSLGLDDLGSCVTFLADEGRWHRSKSGVITAEDFDGVTGNLDSVVKSIEEQGLEDEVIEIATEEFKEIEKKAKVERKKKYLSRLNGEQQ